MVISTLCALWAASTGQMDGTLQFANIGDLKLQSGAVLNDCRVGYRVFGHMNAGKTNAVLIPTWYLGTTADLRGSVRPGGLVDPSRFYVIAVEALTNGVSSSPSTSKRQHDAAFPAVTIRDMVESQRGLLRKLGIPHLHAVIGISMGGIQTFQWITAYPDFMDEAVPIVGSPRPASYDLMFCASAMKALRAAIAKPPARADLIRTFADFFWLALNTPAYYVQHVPREQAAFNSAGFERALLKWDPYDMLAGLQAISDQDIFKPFGEDEGRAASAVHAKLLIVVASQDHCVNPAPALSFAKLTGAKTLVLTSDAGHSSTGAQSALLDETVEKFLQDSN